MYDHYSLVGIIHNDHFVSSGPIAVCSSRNRFLKMQICKFDSASFILSINIFLRLSLGLFPRLATSVMPHSLKGDEKYISTNP